MIKLSSASDTRASAINSPRQRLSKNARSCLTDEDRGAAASSGGNCEFISGAGNAAGEGCGVVPLPIFPGERFLSGSDDMWPGQMTIGSAGSSAAAYTQDCVMQKQTRFGKIDPTERRESDKSRCASHFPINGNVAPPITRHICFSPPNFLRVEPSLLHQHRRESW